MRVSFKDFDLWLVKGFGGILNILEVRITQFKYGFFKLARERFEMETRRLNEFNAGIQVREQEDVENPKTDLVSLDHWCANAYKGLDRMLEERIEEDIPINCNVIHTLEEHIVRLQQLIEKEKAKYG